MGIDCADADNTAAGQAKLVGAFGGQWTGTCSDRQRRGGKRRSILQVIEPDLRQEIALPAMPLVGKISPFACYGAGGDSDPARRLPGQVVGEVKHKPVAAPGIGTMSFQPKQLRNFHFRRHHIADVVKHAMASGGDLIRFYRGPMVGPHDHVPAIIAGDGGRNRPTAAV